MSDEQRIVIGGDELAFADDAPWDVLPQALFLEALQGLSSLIVRAWSEYVGEDSERPAIGGAWLIAAARIVDALYRCNLLLYRTPLSIGADSRDWTAGLLTIEVDDFIDLG